MSGRLDHLNLRWTSDMRMSLEEEQAEIARAQAGDSEAKQRLVDHHIAYAFKIVQKIRRRVRGHDLEDLMQSAQIAILECIESYDASFGTRLITIIGNRVYWNVVRMIPEGSLIRVPGRSGSSGVKNHLIRSQLRPISMDTPVGEKRDGSFANLVGEPGRVVDDADDRIRVEAIIRCLPKLDERSRFVLMERMNGLTLDEVAEKLPNIHPGKHPSVYKAATVTHERVRQIETFAITKLTRYVTEDIAKRRRMAMGTRPKKNGRCAYREALAGVIEE